MQLRGLVAAARKGSGAIHTFERGKPATYTYAQLAADVERARAALAAWGVRKHMRVGIYAPNSYQWLVHDLALIEIGAISVPFTEDFAGTLNQEVLDKYDIALLLLAKKHARLFSPRPRHVAFIDADNDDVAVQEKPIAQDADLDDQHTLVFSSGSAGGLKGLVISRKGAEDTLPPILEAIGAVPGDRLQLFLPMSNLQQRNLCYCAIWYDFDIVLTDYTQLFAAMRALNPTLLLAPPVLFEMIFAEFEKLPAWKRTMIKGLTGLTSLLPASLRRKVGRLVAGDLLGQFGGSMRLLITGMAPIRGDMGKFFERLGLPLAESYGMVEAGSLTWRPPGSRAHGSVGKILRGIDITFGEDGEVLVRRPHILTLRYFQCAEGENERTFVAPGTVATGDVGRMDANGNLFLLGRKKMQIITPGGVKIHPEIIERELGSCPDVGHCIVFLKPGATQLTCVVDLVHPGNSEAQARVRKFAGGMRSIRNAFQHVETVFADEPFTAENGMLRPNMKVDRKAIAAKYG